MLLLMLILAASGGALLFFHNHQLSPPPLPYFGLLWVILQAQQQKITILRKAAIFHIYKSGTSNVLLDVINKLAKH